MRRFKKGDTFLWAPSEFCSMQLRVSDVYQMESGVRVLAYECDNQGHQQGDVYGFTAAMLAEEIDKNGEKVKAVQPWEPSK